ncbi:selenium metabolism-associated LysR family transcriptional regulator [Thermosyntropha sp.]|uniref:selenium metabolism-associated LysR family transcriptional regulator n=1 Tax=Thermosyntropha sp. TaxID=2740820 RepID=UPI0025DB6032|nr:selenium metabolism-associated LysR family transcriptional regulator [Thermosyntropha sp.]MBO8159097.1 LysR family transcriptional regulator [Thermosyntropha sp.]
MNINLLKTYIKVIETQNFSKTAEEFGLSQPAVTKQIQALEDMYGILLIERSGRKLKPTEAGEILYHHAKEIIKAVEKAEKAMEEAAESRKGKLYIGASTIPGQYILPSLLKNFKEKYNHISISMNIGDTEKIISQIAERELDVGIVGGWINNRKIDGFKWLEDELVVIVPLNHALAEKDEIEIPQILSERWIFREKGSGTRQAVEDLLTAYDVKKDDLNIYMEAGSTEAVLAVVESGMGISIVSVWALKNLEGYRKIKVLKIKNPKVKRFFYVIYPKQKTRRKSVQDFLNYIKNIDKSLGT